MTESHVLCNCVRHILTFYYISIEPFYKTCIMEKQEISITWIYLFMLINNYVIFLYIDLPNKSSIIFYHFLKIKI